MMCVLPLYMCLGVGLDTNCFQNYLNFLLAFLKIFPIFPTNLPKFLKIFFKNQYGYKKYKNYQGL